MCKVIGGLQIPLNHLIFVSNCFAEGKQRYIYLERNTFTGVKRG